MTHMIESVSPQHQKLAAKCKRVLRHAKNVLGDDLCGHSPLDLLADNIDQPLSTLRFVLSDLGYKKYEMEN